MILPLLKGEGRGEGERDGRSSSRLVRGPGENNTALPLILTFSLGEREQRRCPLVIRWRALRIPLREVSRSDN